LPSVAHIFERAHESAAWQISDFGVPIAGPLAAVVMLGSNGLQNEGFPASGFEVKQTA
jgi:hypothetical protein